MTTPSSPDPQASLFPDEPIVLEEPVIPELKRPARNVPEFLPLPPMPDGDDVPIAQYAERAYLAYAVSVVKGRALPDVCDGQKPVQRRILYAMQQMGLTHGNKHVKSARVVGDVLGKYHPHGDASAYDAMVRLAQNFSVRYPLIDGQGNFGTRDGDNAAAMRYTEARLTPLADLLLSELDKGTVDFVPNYDGAFKEPALLPARLPMVLLNGASGIAVGMATEIPSHNLREVAALAVLLIQQPELSDDEVLRHILGPDFPGGGQIISSQYDIRECYLSGRGSIKMRARWQVEELARGQWQIVVNELPHGTSSRKVQEEVEALSNPKPRPNKKTLSQDQQQNKQLLLSVLESMADESDKDQAVRLVFQPKSSRQTPDELMSVLLAHTSLETSVPINLTMIGRDGRPQQKSLPKILREWVDFRVCTVRRRCEFRLNQVNDRLHILAGRMIVYLNIDEVIALIRESDDPKVALMTRFELSERQAEDILEIRLRQLAKLEGIKIEKEIKTLEKEKRELVRLLSKDAALREQVALEIQQDAETYGDERRTLIKEAEKSVIALPIVDEPVTVIVSKKHWVRSRTGHGLDLASTSFKAGDDLLAVFECRTTDYCVAICDNGRVCSVAISALPSGRGDGAPLASLIELASGAKIEQIVCGAGTQHLLLATAAGNGFYCTINDMLARNKAGKQFLTLAEPSHILPPCLFTPDVNANVVSVSKSGRVLVFSLAEMKHMPSGGKGILLMGLAEGDELALFAVVGQQDVHIHGKIGKRMHTVKISAKNLPDFIARRARGGRILQNKFEPLCIELY